MNSIIRIIFSNDVIYPILGFGSSDCKCASHLLLIKNSTNERIIETIQKRLDYQIEFVNI
ncbi:MAG: hypothetical protein HZR80_15875 [Candidatus Heimdallarchaeota archaeon]